MFVLIVNVPREKKKKQRNWKQSKIFQLILLQNIGSLAQHLQRDVWGRCLQNCRVQAKVSKQVLPYRPLARWGQNRESGGCRRMSSFFWVLTWHLSRPVVLSRSNIKECSLYNRGPVNSLHFWTSMKIYQFCENFSRKFSIRFRETCLKLPLWVSFLWLHSLPCFMSRNSRWLRWDCMKNNRKFIPEAIFHWPCHL